MKTLFSVLAISFLVFGCNRSAAFMDSEDAYQSSHLFYSAEDDDLVVVHPDDLGWSQKSDQVCTQQIEAMINEQNRWCSLGKNGCEISFLKTKGFRVDEDQVCDKALSAD